jgi:glycosyltransferase involved in cell wall biosynthesis
MVLPSSYEGFGLPYVEAMACGTPVIATSNPGSRFVLEDGRYGVITSDDKLGESVCEMLDNSRLRKDYTDAGLERAQHFNIRTVAKRYLALLT